MNFRNGKTVHTVGEHEGHTCVLSTKTYDSMNLAKKANGLNAGKVNRGDTLPPSKADIDAKIKAEAEAKEAEAA